MVLKRAGEGLLQVLLVCLLVSVPVQAGEKGFVLDAPNGEAQTSTVLAELRPGQVFNIYITPLEQHLGDSLYSTEIQLHFGNVGLVFSRMDPTIINKSIDDPEKLPPIWETRSIVGDRATSVEDPRITALGSAGISLENERPFLVQATYRDGELRVYHRPPDTKQAYLLAKFQVVGRLPVKARVIGYRVKFTLP